MIGHPSRLGGADSELDHQIRCWQAMGIKVHLCHTGPIDANLRSMQMDRRGCIYHDSCDWKSVEGLHCISFCNAQFLSELPEIRKYARTTTFVNCMTWNFEMEIEMQQRGLIDFHLYQTDAAFDRLCNKLEQTDAYRPLKITPYFHCDDFPFREQRPNDKFRFGRISRADPAKFGRPQLWIYETMTAPILKEGMIVGWDHRPFEKFGCNPPSYIRTIPEGGISQQDFYSFCDAIIMTTETVENLPRVGFEAMASGSVLVVDNRGGWQILVQDGVTGWLCDDEREFVYKASRCAFEFQERESIRRAARRAVESDWGFEVAAHSWNGVFQAWNQLAAQG